MPTFPWLLMLFLSYLASHFGVFELLYISPTRIAYRPSPLVESSSNFGHLFTSLHHELQDESIKGDTVPAWLHGAWIKTGFCVFESNSFKVKMLFDAGGCAYQIKFNASATTITAKMMKSKYYQAFQQDRLPRVRTFDEFVPPRKGLDWMGTLLSSEQADNYHVNMIDGGERGLLALTDLAGEMELDRNTMDTKGIVRWDDDLERDKWNMIACAHPSQIAGNVFVYNYLLNLNAPGNMIKYGKPMVYNVLEIDPLKRTRRLLARVPTDRHYYVHECALTNKYYVIIEFPFIWKVSHILQNTAIKNALKFEPGLGIRFKVLDVKTGDFIREVHIPNESFYAFHQINAFEQGLNSEEIVMTMTTYDDIAYHLQHSFSMFDGHLNNTYDLPPSTIRRVTINISDGSFTIEKLGIVDLELAVVSSKMRGKADLQFAYAHAKSVSFRDNGCKAGYACGGTWWDTIVKVRVSDGTEMARWRKDDFWPSEPVFVPRPGGIQEDDGVVLNLVLGDGPRSYLLILDAKDFKQLAMMPLPETIPYQSHGSWSQW